MELIGRSPAIRLVEEEAGYAARSDAKVLLTGESGVGKEIVARLVHTNSARRNAPFVIINSAGVPDTLLESELFGHERGSFTDAYRDKTGMLEAANGGAVFLDEVGEMSLRMQGMLLRFLETGELQRVGATRTQQYADVRVITATNRNLLERMRSGAFREDLYYRLNVIHIAIPPLRERTEDVIPLMDHFLSGFASEANISTPVLTDGARDALLEYHWPGNVRELRNLAERIIVCRKPEIGPHDLRLFLSVRVPAPLAAQTWPSTAESLFQRIVQQRESFWGTAYSAFMVHDITREDLRTLIKMGLEETRGNYHMLVKLFNMNDADYKRFLGFLHKHHCHVPFQTYRRVPSYRVLAAASGGDVGGH